jgi:hypothetical protein
LSPERVVTDAVEAKLSIFNTGLFRSLSCS